MLNLVKQMLKLSGIMMERLMLQQIVLIDILKIKRKKTAIIWVGDDPKDSKQISYKELHRKCL